MASFRYKGRDAQGAMVSGRLEAADPDAAASQLFSRGVTPIDIAPAAPQNDVFAALRERLNDGTVQLPDLIFFSRQMYTLQRAGVPILQALRGLAESAANPALGKVISGIVEALDSGVDLAGALRRYPKVFPPLFVSLVQVGETTGSLDAAFLQLAAYLELERDTRQRVKAALRYPTFVLVAITAAMFVINIFVIPSFAKVYAGFNADLPLPTRIIVGISNVSVTYWPVIVVAMVGAIVGFLAYIRTPAGRLHWDRYKLRLPVVGPILYGAALGRFGRGVAMTLRAGVPVVQGLAVVSRAVDNAYIGRNVSGIRDAIQRGESVTRAAAATGMFPSTVLQMLAVGEETGALDDLMGEVADYYEREVEYALKNLSASIEPILIMIVGIMVLILALGVFLPMWNLANVMGLGRA